LATERTVSAGKYHIELGKRNELNTKIISQAATDLVPLIENDELKAAVQRAIEYISRYLDRGEVVDGVILGCTHYSLLVGELRVCFPDITFFAQTEVIPSKLQMYLGKHDEIKSKLTTGGTLDTFLTGKKYIERE